jgi:short-subunit dehydrogenase
VHTILPGFVETEGFPQRDRLASALLRRTIVEPELVAERIVSAVEQGRREVYVPRWYRVVTLAQALAPGVVASALVSRGYRRSTK